MSEHSVTGQEEGVLGEEALTIARDAIYGEAPQWCADVVVNALENHVAALAAQARADGAAEERKKIARQLVLRGRQWHGDAALMAEELATQLMGSTPSS